MWRRTSSLHIPGYLISPLTGWPIKIIYESRRSMCLLLLNINYLRHYFFIKTMQKKWILNTLRIQALSLRSWRLLQDNIFRIVSVWIPYRSPIVLLSFSYRSPIVLLSFSYCSPIILLSFSYSRAENDRRTIGGWTKNNGRCIDYTSVLKRRDSETQKGNQQCGMERKTNNEVRRNKGAQSQEQWTQKQK